MPQISATVFTGMAKNSILEEKFKKFWLASLAVFYFVVLITLHYTYFAKQRLAFLKPKFQNKFFVL